MARRQYRGWRGVLALLGIAFFCLGAGKPEGADVSGVVRMPDVCSPAASPAVVYLTPIAPNGARAASAPPAIPVAASDTQSAKLALVNQRGLQFVPRVQAIALGRTVRFTNQDSETHNVHVVSPWLLAQSGDGAGPASGFRADPCGCDEACVRYSSPHARLCGCQPESLVPDLRSRRAVPTGRSCLPGVTAYVWHEMGEPLRTDLDVTDGGQVEVAPAGIDLACRAWRHAGREREPKASRRCGHGPRLSIESA